METETLTNRDRQAMLEDQMLDVAQARLRDDDQSHRKRGVWADSHIGLKFVHSAHRRFVEAVIDFVNQSDRIGAGRHNRAAELLRKTGIEPEVISFLFVKGVFNLVNKGAGRMPIKRVSFCIGATDMIHTEWRLRYFESTPNRKALLDKVMKDMDKRTYPKEWRLRTIRMYFDAERLDWQGWTQREKLLVGYSLMVLFRDTTGLIEAPKDSTHVRAKPELVEAVRKALEASVLDFTLYWPMVHPPRRWDQNTNLFRGGYLSKGHVRPSPSSRVPAGETQTGCSGWTMLVREADGWPHLDIGRSYPEGSAIDAWSDAEQPLPRGSSGSRVDGSRSRAQIV